LSFARAVHKAARLLPQQFGLEQEEHRLQGGWLERGSFQKRLGQDQGFTDLSRYLNAYRVVPRWTVVESYQFRAGIKLTE
jgi:hypothetical protein